MTYVLHMLITTAHACSGYVHRIQHIGTERSPGRQTRRCSVPFESDLRRLVSTVHCAALYWEYRARSQVYVHCEVLTTRYSQI